MRAVLFASACAVAQLTLALPAYAQSATDQSANDAQDDEIVVTAERRATSLQRTPIAATVLTGDDLANAGVTSVDQLQFISPGATVNNFGQGNDFNIRGIGKAEHNTSTTTGVITYRDGVATFPGYLQAEPYYDIARVEILRGPQGTFVGQNATGGRCLRHLEQPSDRRRCQRLRHGLRRQLQLSRPARGREHADQRHARRARCVQH